MSRPQAEPFRINIAQEVLDDLQERLESVRWPDQIPGSGWDYGSNLDYMKELVDYWRTSFDWRAQEAAINAFAQYRATVDGLGIHFIHEKGKGPNPMPIIITHGWPSSIVEMVKIIPLLTDPASHGGDPADSFDVVATSAPGYGFSDHPIRRGMHYWRIADLWAELMTEVLGYQSFAAQAGDWGATVTSRLGFTYPGRVVGIHLTSAAAGPQPYLGPGAPDLSDAEMTFLREMERWKEGEGGYMHMHMTKPQTLAYGLNDSPVALAAWIVEKWRTWSDCDGDVERRFTKDELLANVTIYWVTQTINSSMRLYYEGMRTNWVLGRGQWIPVPCFLADFPKELVRPPREWAERVFNVQRWTGMPRGGHFAAIEEPELLAEDIRASFRLLRG